MASRSARVIPRSLATTNSSGSSSPVISARSAAFLRSLTHAGQAHDLVDHGLQLVGGGGVEELADLPVGEGRFDQAAGEGDHFRLVRVGGGNPQRFGPAEGPDPDRAPAGDLHLGLRQCRFEELFLGDHGKTATVTVSVTWTSALQRTMSPTGGLILKFFTSALPENFFLPAALPSGPNSKAVAAAPLSGRSVASGPPTAES